MTIKYDFHLHSCLSPCGNDEMTPVNIVGMARLNGMDCVAIADHNAMGNCRVAMEAGEHYGVTVLPAMELTTAEEVHVLCLFGELSSALAFEEYVSQHIVKMSNRAEIFGNQYICDIEDNVVGIHEQLLIMATDIGIFDVSELVASYKGVAIPAHIDREANGIIAVLGQVPTECNFATVEVTKYASDELVQQMISQGYNVITDSDSHMLDSIGTAGGSMTIDSCDGNSIVAKLSSKDIIINS